MNFVFFLGSYRFVNIAMTSSCFCSLFTGFLLNFWIILIIVVNFLLKIVLLVSLIDPEEGC